jgi:hypothetical protein
MAETYNPILAEEELARRGLFEQPPIPEPGVALVFSGNGRDLLTLKQGQKALTRGEVRWSYNLLYKVDLTEHPLTFQCDVPCKGDAFKFYAEVTFRCKVRQPEVIVQNNITNVAQWIKDSVEDIMRVISRKHEVKESGNAEEEMRSIVGKAICEAGFDLSNFTVKLSLSKEAVEWIQGQTRIELEYRQKEEEAAFQNKQIQLDLQAKLQQQELKHKLAKQQTEFELKLMEQKTNFYSSILQSGNLQLLALQLAQNPGDVQSILQALNQQKQIEREHNVKVLQTLLDADVLEGWKLAEVGKRALQELIGFTEQASPSLPGAYDDVTATGELAETDATSESSSKTVLSEPNWDDEDD